MFSKPKQKPIKLRLQNNQPPVTLIEELMPLYVATLLESLTDKNFSDKNDIETTNISADTLVESYRKGLKAAHDAFELICDAIENNPEIKIENKKDVIDHLREYNTHLEQHYQLRLSSKESMDDYQRVYMDYLQRLEYLTKTNFPEFNAKQLLEKADEYKILTTPRPIVVSVNYIGLSKNVKFHNSKQDNLYFVQIEIPENPLSDEMIAEYLNAYPKSDKKPLWYKGMSKDEKLLFDHAMSSVFATKNPEEQKQKLLTTIQSISSRHRTIPGVANFSRHVSAIIDQNGKLISQFPDRYRSSMVASRDVAHMNLGSDEKEELKLSITKQNIQHIVQTYINNQLRDSKVEAKFFDKAGHIDTKNAKLYLENEVPILLQTLISPGLGHQPDSDLYETKLKAISELSTGITVKVKENTIDIPITFKPHIVDTNHPLNPLRHIRKTGTFSESGKTGESEHRFSSVVRRSIRMVDESISDKFKVQEEHNHNLEMINSLNDLNQLRVDTGSLFDAKHREFHLAALEEFIGSRKGLAHSSCVSGKDRRGLSIIYGDAMELYFFRNNKLPNYSDEPKDRKVFVEIFTEIFLTYHQQILAGLNASIADAIKNIRLYLPDDILAKIKEKSGNPHIFEELERLANNNETDTLLAKAGNISDFKANEFRREYKTYQYYHASDLVAPLPVFTYQKKFNAEMNDNNSETIKENIQKMNETLKKIKPMLTNIINSPLMNLQGEGFLGLPITPRGIKEMRKVSDQDSEAFIMALSKIAQERLDIKQKYRAAMVVEFYEIIIGLAKEIDENLSDSHWLERLKMLNFRIKGKSSEPQEGTTKPQKGFKGEETIVGDILKDWAATEVDHFYPAPKTK